MFLEGLAMHTAQKVAPGLPERDYVAMAGDNAWFRRCHAREEAILIGIARDLDKSGRKIALKMHLWRWQHGDASRSLLRGLDRDGSPA